MPDEMDIPEVPQLPHRPGSLPTLLTYEAAAWEMSVSLSTLKRMLKAGAICRTRKKVGGRFKIPASEILAWAEAEPAPTKRERKAPRRLAVALSVEDDIRALTKG